MGIFSKFKEMRESRTRKSVERYGDTLKNAVTTKEQRLEAIEALESAPPELAAPQLMKRFELVVDHGIQDSREKEQCMEILLKMPKVSGPLVRAAVLSQKRVAWPIKIAEKLFDRETFLKLLLESLRTEFVGFDESVQERNIEILLALKEVPDPRVTPKVTPLLALRDEHVRIAALECLEAQGETSEEARKVIAGLLAAPQQDDNARFLGLVKNILSRHNWQASLASPNP